MNKALVLAGIKGAFIDRDPAVLDRLFSDGYQQHNPYGKIKSETDDRLW